MDDQRPATPYPRLTDYSAAAFNRFGEGHLPGHLGIEIVSVEPSLLVARIPVRTELMAPNGYLHAGTLVVAADSLCGYGCVVNLPAGTTGFTTIELKSNFLGTLREGVVRCEARPLHLGRTTHVWDATLTDERTGKLLATFRCTQLVLWKK
jgi:1,4-dihydroxy-2-naphthoyl-CoA hydrolase